MRGCLVFFRVSVGLLWARHCSHYLTLLLGRAPLPPEHGPKVGLKGVHEWIVLLPR